MAHMFFVAMMIGAPAQARSPGPMKAPADSIALVVDDVTPTGRGSHVVFLTDAENTRIVPVHIGESEAITIAFRLAGRSHPRPQTHDLLDQALRGLEATPVQVHVHTLSDGVFRARVTVRKKRTLLHLDARASDGIALALGHDLPVFMDQGVYDEASISVDELIDSLSSAAAHEKTPDQLPL